MNYSAHHLYAIALSMVERVGSVRSRQLIAYCGGAESVFNSTKQALLKIPGISHQMVEHIKDKEVLIRAEREMEFMNQEGIQVLYYLDEDYPSRLKPLEDAPLCLFTKGNVRLNANFHVAMVGTRTPTERGRWICEKLVEDLKPLGVTIFSGLAYGVDAEAHKASVKFGLPTVGVVAHGLDIVYPKIHTKLAMQMMENGGLITEFVSGTTPERDRFPARNRIIAGITDALIVIESKASGGSMITAQFANEYNKDVFAVPGRVNDEYSKGCNQLIKTHRAFLLEEASDLIETMRWAVKSDKEIQRSLFYDLTREEQELVQLIKTGVDEIDLLIHSTGYSTSQLSAYLLELEFKGLIKSLPGKKYICI